MNQTFVEVFRGNLVKSCLPSPVAVIAACPSLDGEAVAFMQGFSDCTPLNWRGINVGALRASVALRRRPAIDSASGA
jgi:hypothetical protein